MPTATADKTLFFGMDVSQWRAQWRAAADLFFGLPVVRHLAPRVPMILHQFDGSQSYWELSGERARQRSSAARGALPAVQVKPEHVLTRTLRLPPLEPSDLRRAVELDVLAASPFEATETAWGWAREPQPGELDCIRVVLTSRARAQQAVRAAGFDSTVLPEVWVLPDAPHAAGGSSPIVLQGWGEERRRQRFRRGLWRRLFLLALLLVLLAALVVTPTVLVRKRDRQAQRAYTALQQQVGPQLAQREALALRAERLQQLRQLFAGQLLLPQVLDMLTHAVPDGAWLSSIQIEGRRLVLNGLADDAAALVQALAAEPGTSGVHLASPATRRAGANKETFIIELTLDSSLYGVLENRTVATESES